MNTNNHKFVIQKKVLRLACYKAHKFSSEIQSVCDFKFSEVLEQCKNCVWFKVLDESKKVKDYFSESEIKQGQPLTLDIDDMKQLPFDPKEFHKEGGRQ